jgi:hypothetical protein
MLTSAASRSRATLAQTAVREFACLSGTIRSGPPVSASATISASSRMSKGFPTVCDLLTPSRRARSACPSQRRWATLEGALAPDERPLLRSCRAWQSPIRVDRFSESPEHQTQHRRFQLQPPHSAARSTCLRSPVARHHRHRQGECGPADRGRPLAPALDFCRFHEQAGSVAKRYGSTCHCFRPYRCVLRRSIAWQSLTPDSDLVLV